MDPLYWSAVLLVVGLLLVLSEVFLPSGGVLGFLALSSVVACVAVAFLNRGVEAGLAFLAVTTVAVPITLVLAFRWWPKTPMGRRLLLDVPSGASVLPDSPQRRQLAGLIGRVGTASTVMLPSGAVAFEELTVDAVSEGMAIEAGQKVRVVDVRGNRVVVRPLMPDEDEVAARPRSDDILSQPIETLGLDPFQDPLA